MFVYLSKLLPLLIYPLGLACLLLVGALLLRRRRSWSLYLVAAAFLLLWLGGNRLVSMSLVRSLEWQYLPPAESPSAEVIVVLGGGTRSQAYPRPIHEIGEAGDRLLYAAYLYHQDVAPHLLLSGGVVAVDGPALQPEAEAMATLLTLLNVPRDALWLEPRSRNTYENAVESRKLLEPRGINRIVLVTSAMHMPRAVAIFEKQGFEVVPAPTDYLVTQADWNYYLTPSPAVQVFNLFATPEALDNTTRALKEYVGIFVYRLRGWL